jgi:hypothetical protein
MAVQIKDVVKLVVKHGPQVSRALAYALDFIKQNPNAPVWVRTRLQDLVKRLQELRKKKDAKRIRGTLEVVRDVARDAGTQSPLPSPTGAKSWAARADNIGHRVRLAEAMPKAQKKVALALLVTETDALLADLLESIAKIGPASELGTSTD